MTHHTKRAIDQHHATTDPSKTYIQPTTDSKSIEPTMGLRKSWNEQSIEQRNENGDQTQRWKDRTNNIMEPTIDRNHGMNDRSNKGRPIEKRHRIEDRLKPGNELSMRNVRKPTNKRSRTVRWVIQKRLQRRKKKTPPSPSVRPPPIPTPPTTLSNQPKTKVNTIYTQTHTLGVGERGAGASRDASRKIS